MQEPEKKQSMLMYEKNKEATDAESKIIRYVSKNKSSKKYKFEKHIDKEHSSYKVKERLNISENGEDRHKHKEIKSLRGRSHSRPKSH